MARKEGEPNPGRRTRARGESSERPSASVNMDELRELIALLRENGLAEFELEREGFRVRLRRESATLRQTIQPTIQFPFTLSHRLKCSRRQSQPRRQPITQARKPKQQRLKILIYRSSRRQSSEPFIVRRRQPRSHS